MCLSHLALVNLGQHLGEHLAGHARGPLGVKGGDGRAELLVGLFLVVLEHLFEPQRAVDALDGRDLGLVVDAIFLDPFIVLLSDTSSKFLYIK